MQVWVVVTPAKDYAYNGRFIADLEILDQPPKWDLDELGQICFTGNVNGGDSIRWDNGDRIATSGEEVHAMLRDPEVLRHLPPSERIAHADHEDDLLA